MCCPGLGGVRSVLHGFVDLHSSTFSSVHIDVHVDSVAVDEFGIFQDAWWEEMIGCQLVERGYRLHSACTGGIRY